MIRSMLANAKYCKKNPKKKCYKLSDGAKICGCAGGWSVFYATLKSKGMKDTAAPSKKFKESFKQYFAKTKVTKPKKKPQFTAPKKKASSVLTKKKRKVGGGCSVCESKLIDWFMESKTENGNPRGVNMALKVLKSDKYSDTTKAYWKGRLKAWCKKNPKSEVCKKIEVNESLEAMGLSKDLLARIAEEAIQDV